MKYQIYSKDNCPQCSQAVMLLTNRGHEIEELKLGKQFTREELLEQFPGAQSFPQIKVVTLNGEHEMVIGGLTQLKAFLAQ